MSEDTGRLQADPLFLALTRPAMLIGVTYAWFMIEGMISALYFINTSSFFVVIWFILLHGIGVLICAWEPRFFEVLGAKAITQSKCSNGRYHSGTSSYDMYK